MVEEIVEANIWVIEDIIQSSDLGTNGRCDTSRCNGLYFAKVAGIDPATGVKNSCVIDWIPEEEGDGYMEARVTHPMTQLISTTRPDINEPMDHSITCCGIAINTAHPVGLCKFMSVRGGRYCQNCLDRQNGMIKSSIVAESLNTHLKIKRILDTGVDALGKRKYLVEWEPCKYRWYIEWAPEWIPESSIDDDINLAILNAYKQSRAAGGVRVIQRRRLIVDDDDDL